MLEKHSFQLGRGDLEAVVLDEFLESINDTIKVYRKHRSRGGSARKDLLYLPMRIDLRDVPCTIPTVLGKAASSGFWVVPISPSESKRNRKLMVKTTALRSLHYSSALETEFAGLPWRNII